ncbi:MAG: cysteine hydrolase family protein [Bacteroidales bacterium]|nr:cysteine hydrolase family protein [Bacteroidales bacterium]
MWRRYTFFLFLLLPLSVSLTAQKTGLLVIDIQEFYFPGGRMQLENPELAGMNAGLLLDHFRQNKMPVYHVRHNFEPGGNIHPFVKPQGNEPVISKDQVNAFMGTGLLELIQKDSVEQLVICGMQTHMCLEAAVRAAHDLGYSCLVASDACAARALQFEEHIIPAKSVHFSTLSSLQGSYARVLTTDALIKEFSENEQ